MRYDFKNQIALMVMPDKPDLPARIRPTIAKHFSQQFFQLLFICTPLKT